MNTTTAGYTKNMTCGVGGVGGAGSRMGVGCPVRLVGLGCVLGLGGVLRGAA